MHIHVIDSGDNRSMEEMLTTMNLNDRWEIFGLAEGLSGKVPREFIQEKEMEEAFIRNLKDAKRVQIDAGYSRYKTTHALPIEPIKSKAIEVALARYKAWQCSKLHGVLTAHLFSLEDYGQNSWGEGYDDKDKERINEIQQGIINETIVCNDIDTLMDRKFQDQVVSNGIERFSLAMDREMTTGEIAFFYTFINKLGQWRAAITDGIESEAWADLPDEDIEVILALLLSSIKSDKVIMVTGEIFEKENEDKLKGYEMLNELVYIRKDICLGCLLSKVVRTLKCQR